MNIVSWNVNGIRAAQKKGLLDWLASAQPDILALQETKAQPEQVDDDLREPAGYHATWDSAERKGYSGVLLYAKPAPNSIQRGLGIAEYDIEGRTIIAEYDDFTLIAAYFPNGGRDHSRVPFKMAYCADFHKKCDELRAAGHSLVICGDINTAHREIDLARPKQNKNTTGFLPIERAWVDQFTDAGYIDIFRERNPELAGAYSWWSMRSGARAKNIGWRIDAFYITPDLRDRVIAAEIHADVLGSDHCPISLTLRD